MTTFQKLKHEARRAEQRSDWARAIDLYRRALDADEDLADLSLYNRIGDLHLRLGENDAAVEYYERAVERYADNSMHTSAIALCNKILRIAPGRTSVYRRLAVLHARTGLVVEGRGNMMEYVRHVLADGEPEDAAVAVAEFVEITSDDEILVQVAAEQAGRGDTAAAAAHLRSAVRLRTDRGEDTADLRRQVAALDPQGGVATDDPARSPVPTQPEAPRKPDRLATLVAGRLADQGRDVAFEADVPPPPGPAAPPDDLADIRRQADRFRSRVADVLEMGDPTIRYDLGIEFMTIGLLEEAIDEFRVAIADPRLLDAANARIAECLALRGSDSNFEVLRRSPRAAPGGDEPDPGRENRVVEAAQDIETADAPEALEAREADEADPPELHAEPPAAQTADASAEGESPGPEEDDMQGHFFRARLAQYRIRRAEERHTVDHSAHLDLGAAYVEMGLHHEALRELGVALEGPRPIPGRAVRALRELALRLGETPELALEVIERLADSGQGPAAEVLGSQLAEAWGENHPLADRISGLQAHLGGSVDELPALEDMFPALRDTVGDGGMAAFDPSPPADEIESPDVTDEVATETAGPPVDQLLVHSTELVEAGDVEGAVEHLQATLDQLDEGHRTREALVVLERLLELQPDDATLHEQRTELAMMVNDRDQLLASFAGLGACLRRLGAAERARAAYGRMLDVDPTNELARQAIARIDEAEVEMERETRPRGDAPAPADESDSSTAGEGDEELDAMFEFLDGLEHAEVEVVSEDAEGGATADTSETESEDVTARSRYELGLAFRQMGMWEEALRELRPALDRVSDRLGALEAAGECLVKLGRPTEAIALLQSKLRADEDAEQVGPLYILGLALQAEGEQVEAREVLARVEVVQPGYRDTADRLSELSL
jgi:tetratricopeptide (TPR) repeat protein